MQQNQLSALAEQPKNNQLQLKNTPNTLECDEKKKKNTSKPITDLNSCTVEQAFLIANPYESLMH